MILSVSMFYIIQVSYVIQRHVQPMEFICCTYLLLICFTLSKVKPYLKKKLYLKKKQ